MHLDRLLRDLQRASRFSRRTAVVAVASAALITSIGLGGASATPRPTTQTDAASARAAAAGFGITVTSDGFINYANLHSNSLPLTGRKLRTVAGRMASDGSCDFGLDAAAKPAASSATTAYAEEVALNPKTCVARFVTGQLPSSAISALESSSPSAGAPANASRGDTTARQLTAAATSYASAYTVARWIDPVNIVITSQAVNLKWPLYGAGGTLSSSWPYYSFPYDGWSVYGPTFSGFNGLSGNTGWSVQANSHFVNTDFATLVYVLLGLSGWLACGAHLTNRADFYHMVRTYGYRSGSRGSSWSNSVSGACSNMVHIEAWGAFGWWG